LKEKNLHFLPWLDKLFKKIFKNFFGVTGIGFWIPNSDQSKCILVYKSALHVSCPENTCDTGIFFALG
jgi:hypothetical protein